MTRILFVGDIMGRVGRRAAEAWIQDHVEDGGFDLIVANGENSAGGFGITERICGNLFSMGIDIITGGNHSFDKKEILPYLNEEPRLLRPANYPPRSSGKRYLDRRNFRWYPDGCCEPAGQGIHEGCGRSLQSR